MYQTDVINQTVSEVRRDEKLDDEYIMKGVPLLRHVYIDEDLHSRRTKGYIQYIGLNPFGMKMYAEIQLDICHQFLRSGNKVLHIDATGTVASDMPDSKLIQASWLTPFPSCLDANKWSQYDPTITHFFRRFFRALPSRTPNMRPHRLGQLLCNDQCCLLDFQPLVTFQVSATLLTETFYESWFCYHNDW